jgi:adenylate cyclase
MSTEIERKFIVDALPTNEVLPTNGLDLGTTIRQGYIAEEGNAEVRVRMTGDDAVLTVKVGQGRSRTEVELALDADDAEELWAHTEGRRIEKVRHRIEMDGATAELDVYGGSLSGLIVVEVEFESEAAADAFAVPGWFGRELTGDPAWSNASLARRGRPDTG